MIVGPKNTVNMTKRNKSTVMEIIDNATNSKKKRDHVVLITMQSDKKNITKKILVYEAVVLSRYSDF